MAGDAPTTPSPPCSTSDSTVSIRTATEYLPHIESQNPAEAAKSENNLTYGCTFGKCTKTFRSKAKWKCHENKHFQLEAWRCSVWNLDNRECARLFRHRSKYAEHLRDEHNFEETTRKTLDETRIGRNGQYQYWCGFCRVLVRLQTQGSDAWDERLDHIEEHIEEHKRDYSDWLLEEGHRTKGDITECHLLKPFIIPDSITGVTGRLIKFESCRTTGQTESPLRRLPPELIDIIFKFTTGTDQACFAMTCKWLLAFTSTLSTSIPCPRNDRVSYCIHYTELIHRVEGYSVTCPGCQLKTFVGSHAF
ncbi:hypothetical protein AJ80_10013 [Polytolypa hystricis UAMH7299]|uniref:C2H2-type domain-containing protein n=1 Tax=Polytolypa hystricis (strain UAMH7299) TaxID=1447883 RepID=A0A2B7W6L3_POLH7|nr:hypothetical protein AJ80_10013 [Polytolypa hystricis UAMH7299]